MYFHHKSTILNDCNIKFQVSMYDAHTFRMIRKLTKGMHWQTHIYIYIYTFKSLRKLVSIFLKKSYSSQILLCGLKVIIPHELHSALLGHWNKFNQAENHTIKCSINPSMTYASFLHSFLQPMPARLSSRRKKKNQNL